MADGKKGRKRRKGMVKIKDRRLAPGVKIHTSDYDPSFCFEVVKFGQRGMSETEMAAQFGVVTATLRNWAKKNDEFKEALAIAHTLSRAWWEKQSRTGLRDKNFNANLWGKVAAGRYPDTYSDSLRLRGDPNEPIVTAITRTIVHPKEQ